MLTFTVVENFETESSQDTGIHYPPKPVLMQNKKNWVARSLISLVVYAFFFYVLLGGNLTYIAALLLALLIHEFGHFFAMKAYNYSDVKLFVLPLLGAYVTGKKPRISQKQMSVVILAGPVPGVLIGFALLLADFYHPNERLHMLGNIFFWLNLFNLLPFVPLDGGRLLETLFINERYIIRLVFTIISIMALTVIAILTQSLIFLLIPLSMVFSLIMEVKNQKIRDYLQQEHINYTVDYTELPDKNYWSIRDCLLMAFPSRYRSVEPGVYQYSMAEGAIIQHINSILQTPFIPDVRAFGKILVLLLYIFLLVLLPVLYVLLKFYA